MNEGTGTPVWDDARCAEIRQLRLLLNEVSTINKGSDCLGRIARCIELADKLNDTDWKNRRCSFVLFLENLAIADRRPDNEPK